MDIHSAVLRVKHSILCAEVGTTKLRAAELSLPGMSGHKVRHLLNSLCDWPNTVYLEIGLYQGSTFWSALCGNDMFALGIDNWSGCPRGHFDLHADRYRGRNRVAIMDCDALSHPFPPYPEQLPGPFNVFFYDGPHSAEEHRLAVRCWLHATCAHPAIFVVDDWNLPEVRSGTMAGLEGGRTFDRHLLYSREFFTDWNGDVTGWWNGLFVGVVG